MMKRLLQLLLLITLLAGSVAVLAYAGLPYLPLRLTALSLDSYLYFEPGRPDFDAEPTYGLAPLTVTFQNKSLGKFSESHWDFGDGQTSTLFDPEHIYSSAGAYTVTLTINGLSSTDTLTKSNFIMVYEPATALFTATPVSGTTPLEVSFANTSTGDYEFCNWDFGDSISSNACHGVVHTYSSPGVFTVTLTISNTLNVDSLTKPDYITSYGPPEADFSASPLIGLRPLDVTFTDLSTGNYDTCDWDFGDGSSSYLCNPLHTYTDSGYFTVTLTISGQGGTDAEVKQRLVEVQRSDIYLPIIINGPPVGGDTHLPPNRPNILFW